MAERILSGKIKQLVYTTEELSQSPLSTTVIDNGVLVYEKTSSGQIKCKMGDGNNVWSGLEYIDVIESSFFSDNGYKNMVEYVNLTDIPYNYYNSQCVIYNNELHILGSDNDSDSTKHYKWDGSTWSEVSTLPYGFYDGSAVVYNNEIHILGSYSSSSSTKHYKWDGSTWSEVSTLPYGFYDGSALVYNNEIHILGSNNSSSYTKHYKWDGSTWTSVSTLPYSFYGGIALVYNDELNIFSSYTSNYTSHYKFNSSDNTWVSVSNLPYDCSYGYGLVYNNEVHIFCGYENEKGHIKYNGSDWEELPNVPININETGGAILYNNNIHLLSYKKIVKLYDRHYKVKGYCKKGTIINIQNSFPISNNIEVIDNGYRVIQDGIVEIGVYDETSENINTIFTSIFEGMKNIQNQIDNKPSINDNSTSSTKYTYSVNKINSLINNAPKVKGIIDNNLELNVNSLSIDTNVGGFTGNNYYNCDDLPYNFYNGSAVVYNNKINILSTLDNIPYRKKYSVFNTDDNSWNVSNKELPYDFYDGSVVVYNDEIHILGGSSGSTSHYKFNKSDNTWTSVSTLPYSFSDGTAVVYNNEIHILGGSSYRTKHYKWDGSTWTSVSTLPYEFYLSDAVVYNNEIHILGSSGSSYRTKHYKWNGSTWTSVSTLPYDFYYGSAVVCNNEIHILGGSSSSSNYTKHYKWDGSTWTSVSTLPYSFSDGTAVVYNNEIHILGSSGSSYRTKHYKWNGSTWTSVSTLPYDFYYGSALVYNSNIYILGTNYVDFFPRKYHYELNGSTWKSISTLPYEFYYGSTVIYNNEIHILGGSSGSTSHYKFNKSDNTWTSVSTLPYSFSNGSAVVYNNEIHILGGNRSGNETKHYKWDGSTWTSVSTLPYEFYLSDAVVYNNEIHILGSSGSSYRTKHYKWNGSTWSEVSTLPYNFSEGSAVVYNNEIHILGGEYGDTKHYKWDGSTWSELSSLSYRFSNGSAITYNNKIHLLGSNATAYIKKYTCYVIPIGTISEVNLGNNISIIMPDKMDKNNPTGTGSLSMNRAEGSTIGINSVALGTECFASGENCYAEGWRSASGNYGEFSIDSSSIGNETINDKTMIYLEVSYSGDTFPILVGDSIYIYFGTDYSIKSSVQSISNTDNSYTYKLYVDEYESINSIINNMGSSFEVAIIYVDNNLEICRCSHAEGAYTTASSNASHAEGFRTIASEMCSHAEGAYTTSSGNTSHAEGYGSIASNLASHAEGYSTTSSGETSHAEGDFTTASGNTSHAEGGYTIASSDYQHVQGKYNIEDTSSKYAHIVGGGTSNTDRKNIHTLDWNGNAVFSGDVTATKSDGTEVSLLSLQNEVDTKIDELADYVYSYHPLPRTMTVVIDQSNSNPETCITYADDAVGMTPCSSEWDSFFGHYPCLFKNGVEVGRLNPNDFTKFEDGTSADITSGDAGDVMIAFPKLGYKISTIGDVVTVSMTDNPNAEGYCYLAHTRGTTVKDVFYLGAYKGYTSSSKLRSLSGKTPTVNQTNSTFRTQAQANGSGYDQSAFNQLIFRQCMYLLKYKNLDSQTAVGKGYTSSSNSASISTGGTNAKGMDFGETTGTQQMKLFGLEDFWGNVWEFIDGIFSDSSRNILTATENFNDTGSGYTNQGSSGFSSDNGGWISNVQGTSEMGFVIKGTSGSETTYYCDSGGVCASRLACFGGTWGDGADAGAFRLSVDRSASDSSSIFSARLMYL